MTAHQVRSRKQLESKDNMPHRNCPLWVGSCPTAIRVLADRYTLDTSPSD